MENNLIENLSDSEIVHILKVVDDSLNNVELRLNEKAKSNDAASSLSANKTLDKIKVSRPAIREIINAFEQQVEPPVEAR